MNEKKFSFKKFEIYQSRCAMKVGTDSVLLGAWAHIPAQGRVLDIGAGTGILSLMAAQRSECAMITAIEIDSDAAQQCVENVERSEWSDRVQVICGDFTDCNFPLDVRFDAILSNPPFFEQSLLSPDAARTVARHTTTLTYDTIFDRTRALITPDGTLSMVVPADLYMRIDETAMTYGWGASRRTLIHTTARKPAKRVLCEWRRNHYAPCVEHHLTIHDADGSYNKEYVDLTADFYLRLA